MVEQIAKPDFKARMTVRLAVAGAFHTDFMEAAVDKARTTSSRLLPCDLLLPHGRSFADLFRETCLEFG